MGWICDLHLIPLTTFRVKGPHGGPKPISRTWFCGLFRRSSGSQLDRQHVPEGGSQSRKGSSPGTHQLSTTYPSAEVNGAGQSPWGDISWDLSLYLFDGEEGECQKQTCFQIFKAIWKPYLASIMLNSEATVWEGSIVQETWTFAHPAFKVLVSSTDLV